MHIGEQEWRQLRALPGAADASAGSADFHKDLYHRLADREPDEGARREAADFLRAKLMELQSEPAHLPASPSDLLAWMEENTRNVHARYAAYLQDRKAGAPRRYFSNRAHALYVLRGVAPTKLVDGAWLYGLLPHWRNPRLADLVRTYVEELGEGAVDKNHVVLYRKLLASHALDPLDDLDDALYEQGLIQLALAWNAQAFLPEVVGFNLGYEQLPLHLLITSYELNELGLDPYYFTLHVTVDNADTGHARRACQAVMDMLPRLDDGGAFWQRVHAGAKLASAGLGTSDVIKGFDIGREALRILARKATTGQGAHSEYCRIAGRGINDWLAAPEQMPGFVTALEQAGWIRFGEPAEASRFWRLLQGERAEMFGVSSTYELQVLHDWMRGAASADGRPFTEAAPTGGTPKRRATFRAGVRGRGVPAEAAGDPLDPDLTLLREQMRTADDGTRTALLLRAMSPAQHWTPAGLEATRVFWGELTSLPARVPCAA
ncbi:iron-containing redox enzyme family protein [Ramlibacter ginsenosidimutans]|uniref:Iron-containing redox enzyme family protein n=1 Tax=Ramlibacter ginsenosidimutans TaxID=502333 RepID=A0A934TPD8_9BURK|nr:iron-containing redox enzyme family protein [Ramlibacter ginsenosidimutans]